MTVRVEMTKTSELDVFVIVHVQAECRSTRAGPYLGWGLRRRGGGIAVAPAGRFLGVENKT